MQIKQTLGAVGTVILILLISFLTPFSLDMYMPALPIMTEYFQTSELLVNMTMILYFLVFSLAILFGGTISEKYGRKPVLLFSLIIYIVGSIASALSVSIGMLIVTRIVQAVGAGASNVVTIAMIKDCFNEKTCEKVLMLNQVCFTVAPVIAPLIGGQVLLYTDWRMTFYILAAIGLVCLIMSFFYNESLPTENRYKGTVLGSFSRIVAVGRNKSFTLYLIMSAVFQVPFMSYVSVSSYIYVDFFGLTAQVCSYYFAAMAAISALAPFVCLLLEKYISRKSINTLLVIVGALSCACVLLFGSIGPVFFFCCFLLFYVASVIMRPFATGILLAQQDGDVGSASSLINFMNTALACVGMLLATVISGQHVFSLGMTMVVSEVVAIVFWVLLLALKLPLRTVTSDD